MDFLRYVAWGDEGFFFALQALSDWKSRRRSVNSDIVKKKEEREKIEQITYGGEKRSKTFKEMQEERWGKTHRSNRLTAVVVFLLLISGDSGFPQKGTLTTFIPLLNPFTIRGEPFAKVTTWKSVCN